MRSFRIMVTTLLAFWNLASVYHVSEISSEDIFRHPSCLTAPVQESWELVQEPMARIFASEK